MSNTTTLLDQRASSKIGNALTLRAQSKLTKSKSRSQSKMGFSGNSKTIVEECDVDYDNDKVKGDKVEGQTEPDCHSDKVKGQISEIEEEGEEEFEDDFEEVYGCCKIALAV